MAQQGSLHNPALSDRLIHGGALPFSWGAPILSQPRLQALHTDKNSPNPSVALPSIPHHPWRRLGLRGLPREGLESRVEPQPSGCLA